MFSSIDCKDDLGLRSGVIQDSMVSASSHYDEPHTANRARLFANASSDGKIGSGEAFLTIELDHAASILVIFLVSNNNYKC